MKNLQLTERVQKEPNCYQIRQVSTGRAYTFQVNTNVNISDIYHVNVLINGCAYWNNVFFFI